MDNVITVATLEMLAVECKKVAMPLPLYVYINMVEARMMWKSIQKYYKIEESLDEIMALGNRVLVGDFLIYDDTIRIKLKEKK